MNSSVREPRNLGDLTANGPPQKLAIVDLLDPSKPRHVTYAEIETLSRKVACGLLAAGYAAGSRIAIISENRTEYAAAYLGIMRAGMIAVPISFKFPKATIEYALQAAGVSLCFVDGPCRELLPFGFPVKQFGVAGSDGFDALLQDGKFEEFTAGPDDIVPRVRKRNGFRLPG